MFQKLKLDIMQQIIADRRIDAKDFWFRRISHPELKYMSMSHAMIAFGWLSVVVTCKHQPLQWS